MPAIVHTTCVTGLNCWKNVFNENYPRLTFSCSDQIFYYFGLICVCVGEAEVRLSIRNHMLVGVLMVFDNFTYIPCRWRLNLIVRWGIWKTHFTAWLNLMDWIKLIRINVNQNISKEQNWTNYPEVSNWKWKCLSIGKAKSFNHLIQIRKVRL